MRNLIEMSADSKRNIPEGVSIEIVPNCCQNGGMGQIRYAGAGKWRIGDYGPHASFCPHCASPLDVVDGREVFYRLTPFPWTT